MLFFLIASPGRGRWSRYGGMRSGEDRLVEEVGGRILDGFLVDLGAVEDVGRRMQVLVDGIPVW